MGKLNVIIVLFMFINSALFIPPEINAQESVISANTITLTKGEQKIIAIQSPLERVNIVTKGVVSLFIQDPLNIVLRGLAPGSTKIMLQHANGDIEEYSVIVLVKSPEALKSLFEQLQAKFAPLKDVKMVLAEDKIIVSGEVENDFEPYYRQVVEMYPDIIVDLIKGASHEVSAAYGSEEESAVQIDVQVIEINKTDGLDLGIEWFPGASGTPITGRFVSKPTQATDNTTFANVPMADIVFGSFDEQLANVQANLIALVKDGKAKFLSNPKLVVQSGENASFSVGGEIPIAQNNAVNASVD